MILARLIPAFVLLTGVPAGAQGLIDYDTLTHTIQVNTIRAGIHDESGENNYYFKVDMFGLVLTKEERKMEFAKRKKKIVNFGNFGGVVIKSLGHWKSENDSNTFTIQGDSLRVLTSDMMREFGIREDVVAIRIDVTMMEKEKKFGFFGDDVIIGGTTYWPIPEKVPHAPNRSDLKLSITDEKGTAVAIGIVYEANRKKRKNNATAGN